MSRIVLFAGDAQHGKTYAAKMLQEKLNSDNKTSLIINFADLLKFIAKTYFGWNGEKDKTGRELLQQLGTNVVRKRNPKFWVGFIINFIEVFSDDFDYFLISDFRFPDEHSCFDYLGKEVLSVKVVRTDFENELTDEQRNHPSETALDKFDFDYIIESKSGLNNLSKEVDKMYDYYKGKLW
jgi:hypothetical protein